MRDLDIGRRLATAAVTPADLDALGALGLAQRGPYLGAIARLVTAPDPALRVAAVSALAGVRGVPGVQRLVGALADPAADVSAAAVEALRATAREAPVRFAHALFHARPEVRRAALAGDPATNVAELAIYSRGDPDPAAAALARAISWPSGRLALAFELHAHDALTADELAARIHATPTAELRTFLEAERGRSSEAVAAYLAGLVSPPVLAAPAGHDPFDALVAVADDALLDRLVAALPPKKHHALSQRFVAALLGARAHGDARPGVLAAATALHPLLLGHAWLVRAALPDAAAGLVRHGWPRRPSVEDVLPLLALPALRDAGQGHADLASAAAIAGLLSAQRLAEIEEALGSDRVIAALVADDAGWRVVCALPGESRPVEAKWLARVAATRPDRYIALCGHAIATWRGTRLEAFLTTLTWPHRQASLFAALVAAAADTDDQLATVASTVLPHMKHGGIADSLEALFAMESAERARRVLLAVVRAVDVAVLRAVAGALADADARALVAAFEGDDPPPRSRELAVATAYVEHRDPTVRAWAARVLTAGDPAVTVVRPVRVSRALTGAEITTIATCPLADLAEALAPALAAPVTGVVSALASRASAANTAACVALLGCGDPLVDVARELDRHASPTPSFGAELDDATAAAWLGAQELSPLAHGRLWRWERHTEALATWVGHGGGVLETLKVLEGLPGWLARATLWRGIAEDIMIQRYRAPTALAREMKGETAVYVAARIDQPHGVGYAAARIAVALVESHAAPPSEIRAHVLDRVADASAATRELLERIVRTSGLPPPPPLAPAPPPRSLLEQIRRCPDLDELVAWCADARAPLVHEAVLGLLLAGPPGEARLAELLGRIATLPSPLPLLASIAMWESEPALAVARAMAAAAALEPAWQFYLCLGLVARGDRAELPRVFAAARAEWRGSFGREDLAALERVVEPRPLALELADAAHHHAYKHALTELLAADPVTPEVAAALRRFLEVDGERPLHLRRGAAARLLARGDGSVLPIALEHIADERADDWPSALGTLRGAILAEACERLVDAAMIGGPAACSEKRLIAALHLVPGVPVALWGRILDEASTSAARKVASARAVSAVAAADNLGRVADVFAWGVRRGVELTGKLFAVHMTSSERDLGHTYLDKGARIFVSPLPMLRDEAHGQDVVEGLILHELGHHVYHRGEAAQALWQRAHGEGLGPLLNLVADEHLERNLRAVDASYGDRLKRLGAYAFQHAPQEMPLARLLAALRGSAAPALIAADLGVAFDERAVRLRRGAVLGELARNGHPLARFARALRMGLGNRERDPIVEQALALCGGKDLRHLDMPALYALTRGLADLFGGAIAVAQVFGGPEDLAFGEREDDVFGAGISDEALQKEVQRVLDPRARSRTSDKAGGDRLWVNVAPDAEFDRIQTVVRLRGDPALHAALVAAVRRHATRLRMHLDALGIRWQPQTARTAGRALDRGRLRALVTRGDPRILVARAPVRKTDLFLAVIIDCSGSMQAGQNIERAKKFAVLVAEACRGIEGIEARFFGFTDSTIFDAGDARDCAVTALRSDGGNNDAAALFHAANVAAASRKRAKVLVMISDGLPTECSVDALRALVTELHRRRGILCAQVAVRALDEVCFPHYLVLDDANPDIAVAGFGRMIASLVGKALGA